MSEQHKATIGRRQLLRASMIGFVRNGRKHSGARHRRR